MPHMGIVMLRECSVKQYLTEHRAALLALSSKKGVISELSCLLGMLDRFFFHWSSYPWVLASERSTNGKPAAKIKETRYVPGIPALSGSLTSASRDSSIGRGYSVVELVLQQAFDSSTALIRLYTDTLDLIRSINHLSERVHRHIVVETSGDIPGSAGTLKICSQRVEV